MRREYAVVVVVLLLGYSLYGVLFVTADASPGGQNVPVAGPGADGAGNSTASFQFEDVSASAGFEYAYQNDFEATEETTSNAGVYANDFDNDDWTDLLAIGGESPILFENDRGQFHPSNALPSFNHTVQSALWIDYDRDGWEDLLLLFNHESPVLLENREGTFVRVDDGIDRELAVPVGASTADFDEDGCPDLLIVQNGDWKTDRPEGLQDYSVPDGEDNGNSNLLFEGTCDGFTDVTDSAGIHGERWSLATSFVDFTGDGDPDVHVTNDYNADVLYVNDGNGSFSRQELGPRTNRNGMSSEIGDVNGDGTPEIFVTNIYFPQFIQNRIDVLLNIRGEGNNLLVIGSDGTVTERAAESGVLEGGWGWAAVLEDLDNDGRKDLFHTTKQMNFRSASYGFSDSEIESIRENYRYYRYPRVWAGTDDSFAPVNAGQAGFTPTDGRGVAALDYDRDGDLDLAVASAGGEYRLYENTVSGGSSIQIDVDGNESTSALGTRVYVEAGAETQMRIHHAESDYLSQDTRILHVGTGNHTHVDVHVVWPGGENQTYTNVRTDQYISVTPGGITRESID